jgi:site-specific DNA recombinase
VPIPVPACLPRELVDRARVAFEANNGSERKRLARPWELRGLMRCSCGRKMGTHTITWKPRSEPTAINYHYYLCHDRKEHGKLATCTQKAVNVHEVEAPVWKFVSGLLKDPERIRSGMERLIDQERASVHADPEREAKAWLEKLAEADRQRARAQDLAVEGLLSPDELRTKLAQLAEVRDTAERELSALQNRRVKILELEADRDALLGSMARMVPESLDGLTGEERNKVYRMLRLEVTPKTEGGFGVTGAFCSLEPIR